MKKLLLINIILIFSYIEWLKVNNLLKNAYKNFWVPVMGRFITGFIPLLEGKIPENKPTYDIDGEKIKKNN